MKGILFGTVHVSNIRTKKKNINSRKPSFEHADRRYALQWLCREKLRPDGRMEYEQANM